MSEPNIKVLNACIELALNLECDRYFDHPYCIPFLNYISLWPVSLPIKTIIVGQNPYPEDVYPQYGCALAYDEAKRSIPTASVRVLAEDLYHYKGIYKRDTIRCFRDLWMMLDEGILAINETVFTRLLPKDQSTNIGPMREAEFQIRALQVLIAQSYAMGQQKIECVAMGVSAKMASSILREWCPNDLISFKLVSCSNPAAFASQLRDRESQTITLKNDTVSKILAGIVDKYLNMAPKQDKVDKRYEQNKASLETNTKDVVSAAQAVRTEYASFAERLRGITAVPEAKAAIEDLSDSLTSLVKAIDRNATALSAQTLSFIMFAQTAQQKGFKTDSNYNQSISGKSMLSTPPSQPVPIATPARRVVKRSTTTGSASQSKPQSIAEENEDSPEAKTTVPIVETPPTPEIAPARRRVVKRSSSMAPSVAESEYTSVGDDKKASNVATGINKKIDIAEGIHMKSFAM